MKKNNYFQMIFIFIFFLVPCMLFAKQPKIKQAAKLGWPMPEFRLTSFQGEEISISQFKGKNVLLIFPRGRYENQWCRFCHYQYAELVELEKKYKMRNKYNLEILFVMPYTKDEVRKWAKDFKRNLGEIEVWKNPPNPDKISRQRKEWAEIAKRTWPKKFDYGDGSPPLLFPVLIDAARKVSIGLELFRTEWNLSRVEQNVPAIFIIGEDGILKYKYISQSTMDRPSFDYIFKFIQRMIIKE